MRRKTIAEAISEVTEDIICLIQFDCIIFDSERDVKWNIETKITKEEKKDERSITPQEKEWDNSSCCKSRYFPMR